MKQYQLFYILFIFLNIPIIVFANIKSLNSLIIEPFLPSSLYLHRDFNKRQDIECEFLKAFNECKEAIKSDYYYCMKDFNKILSETYAHENNCPDAMSDKCQVLYKEGHYIKSECRQEILKGYIDNEKKAFEVLSSFLKLVCTKDEEDHYCAYNDIIIEEEPIIQEYEKILYNIVNATCYSKSCTDTFVNYYDHVQHYIKLGYEYMTVKLAYESQTSQAGVQRIIDADIEEKIRIGNEYLAIKKTYESQQSNYGSGKKNNPKEKKIKRSFAIENMAKLQIHEIFNKTLQYLNSSDCHNTYLNYKNSQSSNAYSYLNPIPMMMMILLYSLLYLFL
ncbi:hypothetical protein PIROE2DRAFT_57874 [Piromyces sp. E2]|nr:hypothetical protein PIROE2DRAFT_57874 [Piromyces sp. E2]|eukprot:OUM68789.1 hypothetical protein PIROE2DRAFT_57874 [Piromyces sp. E2]